LNFEMISEAPAIQPLAENALLAAQEAVQLITRTKAGSMNFSKSRRKSQMVMAPTPEEGVANQPEGSRALMSRSTGVSRSSAPQQTLTGRDFFLGSGPKPTQSVYPGLTTSAGLISLMMQATDKVIKIVSDTDRATSSRSRLFDDDTDVDLEIRIRGALTLAVDELRAKLEEEVEARLGGKNIVRSCDAALRVARKTYGATFKAAKDRMLRNQRHGFQEARKGLHALRGEVQGVTALMTQRKAHLAELIFDAARLNQTFKDLMVKYSRMAAIRVDLSGCVLDEPCRILEKALLPVDSKTATIFLLSATFVTQQTSDLVFLVDVFRQSAAEGQITLVRALESSTEKSRDGWAVVINFYLNDDTSRHVCEARLTHTSMILAARELSFEANEVYDRTQVAEGLLVKLGMPTYYNERLARLRGLRQAHPDWTADAFGHFGNLIELGLDITFLLKVGFSKTQLLESGVTQEALDEAKKAEAERKRKKAKEAQRSSRRSMVGSLSRDAGQVWTIGATTASKSGLMTIGEIQTKSKVAPLGADHA